MLILIRDLVFRRKQRCLPGSFPPSCWLRRSETDSHTESRLESSNQSWIATSGLWQERDITCTLCKPLKLGISLFSCLPCFLTNTDGYPVTRGYKFYFGQLLSQLYFQKPGVAPPPSFLSQMTPVNPRNVVTLMMCLFMAINSRIILSGRNFSVEHSMPIFSLKSQMTRRIWKHLRALGCIPIFPNP